MSGVGEVLDGMAGIVRRDAQLFFSYRFRALTQPLTILATLTLFFYISRLVRVPQFPQPRDYFAFVVVGILVVELLTAALTTTPVAVRTELVAGTFERLVTSPLGPVAGLVAMCAFPVLLALGVGVVTVGLATLVFGFPLEGPAAVVAVPVALLGAAAFLPFALLVVAVGLLFKQATAASAFVVTGLSLSSGAFFPADLLPKWVSWVPDVQPLTPTLQLMRAVLLGSPVDGGRGLAVLKLVGWTVLVMPLGLVALRAAIDRCRRTATLTEY